MSKNEIAKNSASGLTKSASPEGIFTQFTPDEFFVLGFSEQKILKIGDPANGGVPGYIGQLIGQGPDIAVNAVDTGEVGSMPTFEFFPVDTSTLKVNEMITHRVVCGHQLNEAFTRILARSVAEGKCAIAGAFFTGKTTIQGGKKSLNTFRIFERYLPLGESLKPFSPVIDV